MAVIYFFNTITLEYVCVYVLACQLRLPAMRESICNGASFQWLYLQRNPNLQVLLIKKLLLKLYLFFCIIKLCMLLIFPISPLPLCLSNSFFFLQYADLFEERVVIWIVSAQIY